MKTKKANGILPWERQPGEPMMWYTRFDKYYRIQDGAESERNLRQAYHMWRRDNGNPPKPTTGVSSAWTDKFKEWNWKDRAEAWDMEQHRLRMQAEEEERAEMLKEHITLARALWQRGAATLKRMQEKKETLTHEQARQYIKDGISLERQARGLPEYLLEVAQLTDEELQEQYAELLAKVSGPGSGDALEGLTTEDKDD